MKKKPACFQELVGMNFFCVAATFLPQIIARFKKCFYFYLLFN